MIISEGGFGLFVKQISLFLASKSAQAFIYTEIQSEVLWHEFGPLGTTWAICTPSASSVWPLFRIFWRIYMTLLHLARIISAIGIISHCLVDCIAVGQILWEIWDSVTLLRNVVGQFSPFYEQFLAQTLKCTTTVKTVRWIYQSARQGQVGLYENTNHPFSLQLFYVWSDPSTLLARREGREAAKLFIIFFLATPATPGRWFS